MINAPIISLIGCHLCMVIWNNFKSRLNNILYEHKHFIFRDASSRPSVFSLVYQFRNPFNPIFIHICLHQFIPKVFHLCEKPTISIHDSLPIFLFEFLRLRIVFNSVFFQHCTNILLFIFICLSIVFHTIISHAPILYPFFEPFRLEIP